MKRKRQTEESPESSAAVASPDTDVESFGPWLQRQREGRGIDRREVADASKISVRYIDALETNRFEVLPAEVFTKGFLRQYAAYVGLDPEEVVNYYLAALQAQRDREEPDLDAPKKPRSSGRTNLKWLLAAILVAAVLLAVVWLISRASNGTPLPWSTDAPSATSSSPDPVPAGSPGPSTEAPSRFPSSVSGGESSQGVAPGSDPSSDDAVPAGDPDATAGDPSSSSAATPPASTPPATAPPAVGSGSALVVVVDFAGDCWVEAILDGGRRLAEMRVQGESLRLEAESSIDLKLGNGRVVEVQVNGEPYPVRTNPGSSVADLQLRAPGIGAGAGSDVR